MSICRKDIKELDKLWALTVKEKADYKCEHCGRYDSRMEAAHVVGRRHRATRWGTEILKLSVVIVQGELTYDLCGHCLCHVCHQNYDEHGPLEPEIVERTVGKERKAVLQALATRRVAKDQLYEDVLQILERERAANDDSPYSND
jgi:hypothetical protein